MVIRGLKVIRGGRSDPLRFWPEAKRKIGWSRYLPLWGGAVVVGLAIGFWPNRHAVSGPDQPILWNETQSARQAVTDSSDQEWASRAQAIQQPETAVADPSSVRASFGYCHTGGGTNCVVDGDTIWLNGQNIRIADIDAPETHDPRCPEELALGYQATQRLHALVNSGAVTMESIGRDTDRFGRKLRVVLVDGSSVGSTLVGEGLARWYEGGKRPWC